MSAQPAFGVASVEFGGDPNRRQAATTGAFFQAADFNEWEGLDQRLTGVEKARVVREVLA